MINTYIVYCHHRDAASSISTLLVQQWVEWQIYCINHYSLENSSFQHSVFSFLLWSRITLCSIIVGNYPFAQLTEEIHNTSWILLCRRATRGGAFAPLPKFSRNFQIIKLKFCILIISKKSLTGIFLCLISLQDISWDRPSDQKFRKWLVFNHKYAGIGRSFKLLVAYFMFILLFVYHSEKFQKCSVCLRFDFVSCHLLRKRVCIHSWNVNYKYWIAVTPVEQSLHPLEYAQWQKRHTRMQGRR